MKNSETFTKSLLMLNQEIQFLKMIFNNFKLKNK